jgi:WD40 repeat protein
MKPSSPSSPVAETADSDTIPKRKPSKHAAGNAMTDSPLPFEPARLVAAAILLLLPTVAAAQKPIVLEGHENVVSALAFSDNGERLYSASWDKTVCVWNTETGQSEKVLRGHTDWVFDLFLPVSPEGTVQSVSQNELVSWSKSLEETARQTGLGGAKVNSAAFSPNGKLLAIGGRDGFVRVRSVEGDSPPIEIGGFRSWVGDVCFSADARVLAAGTRTGNVRIFELPSAKQLHSFEAHPGRQVLTLRISPDGKSLATGGFEQTARLWDVETGKETATLSGHRGVVTTLTWSADGRFLATGERHGTFHVWDTSNSNTQLTKITAHSDGRLGFSVTALAFSPDGKRIASGSYDKTIKIWTLPIK